MTADLFARDAVAEFTRQINQEIALLLKQLIEEKHLYQRVRFDEDRIFKLADSIGARVLNSRENRLIFREQVYDLTVKARWVPATGTVMELSTDREAPMPVGTLILLNVRLFCTSCHEKNVFSPVYFEDAANKAGSSEPTLQLVFVAYQCQHCKGAPEGILIRREGWKFSLDGRSPMEELELPAYIPKKEQALYRDGLIAGYAGKQLAAVFYLRCFIEQFARRQVGMLNKRKTGDEIMDAYAKL